MQESWRDSLKLHHLLAHPQDPICHHLQGGSDKCVPMVETVMLNYVPLDIQYHTGCQLNLSALKLLPNNSYALGTTTLINLLAFDNFALKMIAVDTNLSSGSAFSFPTPSRWRRRTGSDLTSYSGKVSILLRGEHFIYFLP